MNFASNTRKVFYDLFHIFAILPLRLKYNAILLSLLYVLTSSLEFLSLISIGALIFLIGASNSVLTASDTSSLYAFFAYTYKSVPRHLFVFVVLLITVFSYSAKIASLYFTPLVVTNLTKFYSSKVFSFYMKTSLLDIRSITMDEFRTILTEDLNGLINNTIRPVLSILSSLLSIIVSVSAALLASPLALFWLSIISLFTYLIYNQIYFSRVSAYLSKSIPELDRVRSSLLEYVFNTIETIKLYKEQYSLVCRLANIDSSRMSLAGLQNTSVSLPRLLIEAVLITFFVCFCSFVLLNSASTQFLDPSILSILSLSIIRIVTSFQLVFQNYGTIVSNTIQLSNISSKL